MPRVQDNRLRRSRSGAAAHALPKCKYENLVFTRDKVTNKDTFSNVALPNAADYNESNNIQHSSNLDVRLPSPVDISSFDESTARHSFSDQQQLKESNLKRKVETDQTSSSADSTSRSKPKKKYDGSQGNDIDLMVLKTFKEANDTPVQNPVDESADFLFFKSLLPAMAALSKKQNRKARMKIQEIIFELEDSDLSLS